MPDINRIQQLVNQGRRRLRAQSAIEVATFSVVPAAVVSAIAVFAVRQFWIPWSTGLGVIAGAGLIAAVATVVAYFRPFSTEAVATRIDRASKLSDRLATAWTFQQILADPKKRAELDPQTEEMMRLAVADGIAASPKANVPLATPFRRPVELPIACAFVVIAAFVSFLGQPAYQLVNLSPADVIAEAEAASKPKAKDLVALDDDDFDYSQALIDDLMKTARDTGDKHLEDYAKELKDLLELADDGELSKQDLLEKLAEAEKKYNEGTDEAVDEAIKELEKTGKELQKEKLTKELGKALEQNDLEKAQKEMEKLAEKLDKNELSEKDQQKIAKAMEKAAEKFEQREKKQEKADQKKEQKTKEQISKLKRQLKEAKTERQKSKISRRLEQKKRELKKLERKKQQQQKSASKRELKQLHRNMKKAAQQMKQKSSQQSRRQASKKMRDMQRNTGKVNADKRKMTNKRKMASQMRDLKDAMRRAKRKGNRGPKDRFGRNKRNKDFGNRARGGKGSKQAWKPGQTGQGKNGKNGKKPGGKGKKPGGSSYGDGHDPNLLGDSTQKSGNTKDQDLQGVHGKGPSTRETILTAAEKGFATRSYEKVYAKYKVIVEEVINAEKVPAGYKYYVKKYFQKIKPQ